jgi:tellurite methyltransferase
LTACLWGTEYEPLLDPLVEQIAVAGAAVLDAGCGEGRNAVRLARLGASVTAVDVSELALANAREMWPGEPGIRWQQVDLLATPPQEQSYDIVLSDSVLHWMPDDAGVVSLVDSMQRATKPGGLHMICSFNDRIQQFEHHAHPPRCLLAHERYLELYRDGWEITAVADVDIESSHADVPELHHHSVTKFLARRTG